jgi:phage host-nuclease inhibitor protein Gam
MTRRIKAPAETVVAPQTRAEAEQMLARLGALQRDLALIESAASEAVAVRKATAEEEAKPIAQEAEALRRGLQLWAEANRPSLTDGGRTKTVTLATGEIAWRLRPPSVRLKDMPKVVEALVQLGLGRFLRTKQEVDKEAMLKEPAEAMQVPGVSIGSEGEEFVVTPLAVELSNAAPRAAAPLPAGGRAA